MPRHNSEALRLGFLPVSDCAPLVVAKERGIFRKYGLQVELLREAGWSIIRDKVIYGEIDAAHAPATLPFVANLGLDSDQCASITGMVLSLQGNAITMSSALYARGARDAAGLKDLIFRDWGKRTYTFGVVFPYSSQYFLMRQWMRAGGINPEAEVRIVVVPPSQMFPALKMGYLDGYCVGEPWTSVAVEAGSGVCVATSEQLAPWHPEKVLMVRREFAEERADEHERLIAALIEACEFCDQPEHRGYLSKLLSAPQYVNAPAECLRAGLVGPFDLGERRFPLFPDHTVFSRRNANDPTDEKATWVMEQLYEILERRVLKTPTYGRVLTLKNVFRRDIHARARRIIDGEDGLKNDSYAEIKINENAQTQSTC